jgi:hypothetical protein
MFFGNLDGGQRLIWGAKGHQFRFESRQDVDARSSKAAGAMLRRRRHIEVSGRALWSYWLTECKVFWQGSREPSGRMVRVQRIHRETEG